MEIYRKRSEGKSVGATVKGNGEREMRESCSRRKRKSGRGRVKRGGKRQGSRRFRKILKGWETKLWNEEEMKSG